ncbi:unnamed protein product [Cercopithifilaria johnstoni]|uniref:C3H1-type domain-containing protein n=1 Tax=Cercopithifilaria johnstoni TaxID=2874296 RepID=A0A8J2MAJ0_9BILA|nr:unnamed protein product [Cercopithifilaria johnstoni]
MATVFPHPAPGDPVIGYQLSEVSPLPPQPISILPTPLPVIPPPQGTVYFQPPYIFQSGLLQPIFCEQPNVPPSLENTTREGPTSNNAGTVQGMFFRKLCPYIRPNPVLFVLSPFPETSAPGNPLPPLPPSLTSVCSKSSPVLPPLSSSFASAPYQSWPTTNPTSQSPTVRMTPRKDSILSTGTNQSSFKFSGNDDCRNFQRDNANRSELICRNRSGPLLNNYRTKLCINFKNGHCPYGDKCRFIHQQGSDSVIKTKFSTNAPAFVPRANAMVAKPNSPSASLDMVPPNRLYSSTPVSLLAKGQSSGLDVKERPTTPTGRRVSYRQDFSAGYRRPSVADGPHPLPAC